MMTINYVGSNKIIFTLWVNILLLLSLNVVAQQSAAKCTVKSVSPFPSSMYGMTYTRLGNCNFPNDRSSVRVDKKLFKFVPFYNSGTGGAGCPPYQLFVYNKEPKHPVIINVPEGIPEGNANYPTCKGQDKNRARWSPVGKTKQKFQNAVKEMINEISAISWQECVSVPTDGIYYIEKPGRNFVNVDVELVLGYLRTLAHRYAFCV